MKAVNALLIVVGMVAMFVWGFFMGNVTQITTYESDLAACTNACESNGGFDHLNASVYCSCENGAYFSEDDFRK